ncbi:MAG: hypothetical protein IJV27_01920 [Prevotella sp.]|nr:hypothetical protein [Prevotella sp.]
MKKQILSIVALAAMLFAPQVLRAQDSGETTEKADPIVYDFAGLTTKNDLTNLNYGQPFYVWESESKADSRRQDFKGYQNYTGTNLTTECHVWRRSDRLSGNLVDGGINCPNDREMVINGLTAGSVVKITYDATNAAEDAKEMIWATGATAGTIAKVAVTTETPATDEGGEATSETKEVVAVSGETPIQSGAEIKILYTEGGYFGFKVKKGMIISKVEITTAETTITSNTPATNDFEAEAKPVITQPVNLNYGSPFYVWEGENKADSRRQDFKGYTWEEGLALPEECHVWRRSDRINGNIIESGLKCPNDREMVVNGITAGSKVTITYDATDAAEDAKEMIWATAIQTVEKPLAWNFSDWAAGDITETTTIDGLTVAATSSKKVSIDGSNKTVDGVEYTQRLKFGGTGSAEARYVSFEVPGNTTISLVYAHASSSGDDRTLNIAAGEFGNIISTMTAVAGEVSTGSFNYEGDATTIYIYSANSGINLYAINTNATVKEQKPRATAKVGGDEEEAVSGETTIPSGVTITVLDAEEGYFGFKVRKNMVISKIEIVNGETTLAYDFTTLTTKNDLNNLNYGQPFYVWESAEKADSRRQDFKGYQNYTGKNLESDCHIWRRSDRLSGNLVEGGLKCPNDREMVISGLTAGSVVKITYDASATVTTNDETGESSEPLQMLWATAPTPVTFAKIATTTTQEATEEGGEATTTTTEEMAVSGETAIPSGAEIKILYTEGGYFGFKVKKGMIINKVEITTAEVTTTLNETDINDFAEEAKPVTENPDNLNGSASNGQAFYVWESESKADSYRQDFKGYAWKEGSSLPEVCHVWRRSDRINGNIVEGGLKCPNDREMVIDGLKAGSKVTIVYDATGTVVTNDETGESSEPKQILYATGASAGTLATVETAAGAKAEAASEEAKPAAVSGETAIPSGAAIRIAEAAESNGYFGFKVFKGMVISKITIEEDEVPVVDGIQVVKTEPVVNDGAWYTLQGIRVAQPTKGIYIHNGKKIVVK